MKNEIQSRTVFALLHLKKVHTVNTGIHCKFALAQTGIFTQLFQDNRDSVCKTWVSFHSLNILKSALFVKCWHKNFIYENYCQRTDIAINLSISK